MGVSLRVGGDSEEIGTPSFLNSFFSTVYVRLENESWGSRFPTIMRELFSGRLDYGRAEAAVAEIRSIRESLGELPPDRVVWDYENRKASPPWGDDISPEIKSLADYFVTSRGKNLLDVLLDAFEKAARRKADVRIA